MKKITKKTASRNKLTKLKSTKTYVPRNICSPINPVNCLYKVNYIATRSDGRKVKVKGIYDFKGEDKTFQPHFLMDYMKELRNAYIWNPAYGNQLYDQDYLITRMVQIFGNPDNPGNPANCGSDNFLNLN